jgi:hypothetical protein
LIVCFFCCCSCCLFWSFMKVAKCAFQISLCVSESFFFSFFFFLSCSGLFFERFWAFLFFKKGCRWELFGKECSISTNGSRNIWNIWSSVCVWVKRAHR